MVQTLKTDIAILGAGPVGLFAVFQCGMLGMKCHVIDTLEATGGQCTALYPEKPIYDVPAYPEIKAASLITRLEEQAAPFKPVYHLNQKIVKLDKTETGCWVLSTSSGQIIEAKAVIIAGGVGAFGPNRPPLKNIEHYEGTSIFYLVKNPKDFAGKRIVIAGGGDSAVDWALSLSAIAKHLVVVHRRDKFRAAPANIDKLHRLAQDGKIDFKIPYQLSCLKGENGSLKTVEITSLDGQTETLQADILLPFFGLSMKLGPIAEWGIDLDHHHIKTNPATGATNVDGIYAIGDMATYDGKLKLILCGFSEAAMTAHAVFSYLYPDKELHFEYSTVKGVPRTLL